MAPQPITATWRSPPASARSAAMALEPQRPAAAAVPVVVNDGLAEDLLDLEPRALSAERSRADRDAGDAVGAGPRGQKAQDPRRRDPPPWPTEAAACERAPEQGRAGASQELSPSERSSHETGCPLMRSSTACRRGA